MNTLTGCNETIDLRGWLRRELEERGYRLLDSQANFLTFDCQMDALDLAKLMERKGVIIRPTTSFGLDGHCRVSIAPRPLLERFLQALDEVTSSIRGDGPSPGGLPDQGVLHPEPSNRA